MVSIAKALSSHAVATAPHCTEHNEWHKLNGIRAKLDETLWTMSDPRANPECAAEADCPADSPDVESALDEGGGVLHLLADCLDEVDEHAEERRLQHRHEEAGHAATRRGGLGRQRSSKYERFTLH